MEFEHSLIARVRRGEINFERLVEVLSERGYITDVPAEEGIGFGRASMDQTWQEDFDALFSLLLPGIYNDIKLDCTATDKDGIPGCFTYALFNKNVIDREDMTQILMRLNRATAKEFG